MKRERAGRLAVGVVALLMWAWPSGAQTKLLRFPDIHDDKVVFTYGGDLWLAPTSGGSATRLTAHPGLELFAKFSPDGKWIAFTGQYDGDEQVYVIPATGGVPKQLTYYPARGPLTPRWGYDNQVYGWTSDGKAVLFRSLRDHFDLGDNQLYTVSVEGGLPKALPMPFSGAGDYAPDGVRMVYSPLFRDFRTWKRYSGGWAQQLYIFDLKTHASEKITDDPRCHRDPMWIGNKIYYSSDKDDTLNLYVYDPATKKTEQLTHSKKWDLRWPSTDHKSRIVYEMDGELNILDATTGESKHISIEVPTDAVAMRPSRVPAARQIEGFSLSPKGERAVIVARGDVFSVPIEKGPTRNLTNSSNAHDKWGRWSPDGTKIAFISDMDGEDEVYLINQDGSGKPEQLTHGYKAMLYAPEWAPDGKRIAFADKDAKLYVLTLEDKKVAQVAQDPRGFLRDYVWSSDGQNLAFTLGDTNDFRSVYVWSAADGQTHRVTSEFFDAGDPAWDASGNYLYFVSQREYAPQLSQLEFNFATNRSRGIFAATLRKDGKNPFPPESDEVTITKEGEKPSGGDKEKPEEKKKQPVKIDFDGLGDRVTRVPVEADNYAGLALTSDYLVYAKFGAPFLRTRFVSASDTGLVFTERPQRKHAGRENPRIRAVARWEESSGARGAGIQAVRREAGRESRGEDRCDGRADGGSRAAAGMGGGIQRSVAALPGLFLREEHARVRLGGATAAISAAGRLCGAPIGFELRAGGNGRGTERLACIHRRRRLRNAAAAASGAAGRALCAGRGCGTLQNQQDFPRTERGRGVPVAADGSGRGCARGRLRAGDRRPGANRERESLQIAFEQSEPAGAIDAKRETDDGRSATDQLQAHYVGAEPDLPGMGEPQPRSGGKGDGRTRRLHSHPGHGGGRNQRVHQNVLPANPEGGNDRGRARKRRRKRFANAHRAAAPGAVGDGFRPIGSGGGDLPGWGAVWTEGLLD